MSRKPSKFLFAGDIVHWLCNFFEESTDVIAIYVRQWHLLSFYLTEYSYGLMNVWEKPSNIFQIRRVAATLHNLSYWVYFVSLDHYLDSSDIAKLSKP